MEIGGYYEFENFHGEMLHNDGIKLNLGRNALAYLIEARNIKRILMPYFMCDSCDSVIKKYNIEKRYYSIDSNFYPININLKEGEWLYVVNYYGQLSEMIIKNLKKIYKRIIVDNTQAYFMEPVDGVDTIYSCRKFFGVPDGAILYTDGKLERDLSLDYSYNRMEALLGRYEKDASDFYTVFCQQEKKYDFVPICRMSRLTENLLKGINYERIRNDRTENFVRLHEYFENMNKLELNVPSGAYAYPLLVENGKFIRKKLQEKKIYIPCLWPNVLSICQKSSTEFCFANDILPLPVDQRYGLKEIQFMEQTIQRIMENLDVNS